MTDNAKIPCKCLLKQAGETELAQNIEEYVSALSEEIKADEQLYRQRLSICESCVHLLSGTCTKCGCYVEMRAAVKNNRCPSEEKFW